MDSLPDGLNRTLLINSYFVLKRKDKILNKGPHCLRVLPLPENQLLG
jgi:hypothetical protein